MGTTVLFILLNLLVLAASDSDCPKRCVCRTRRVPKLGKTYFVNCKRRGFGAVPDLSALKGNGLPKRLDLAGNRIRSISQNDFPQGLNVAMLVLESNENIKLLDSAFVNLADTLQYLGLQSIHLMFVSPFTFLRGLNKLEKLILDGNYQRDDAVISPNLFKDLGLDFLKEISMYNCRIGGMEDGAFSGIEHLHELDLTFNWLKDIPPALKDLRDLKKLLLKLNHIKTIARRSFEGMRSLSEIVLSDNDGLQIISGSFTGLEDCLKSLTIRSCDLSDVPQDGIRTLRKLEILNIGYNPLVDMSTASLKGDYCLKTLDISKSLFLLRPNFMLPQKDCITTLFLNERRLTEIPKHFLRILTKLDYVSMTKNKISSLKFDSLSGIMSKGYDLSDNPLISIAKGAFTGIGPGITLGLKRTNMTDLQFVLEYPSKTFRQLYLEGANITCNCIVYEAMQLSDPWTLEGQCLLKSDAKDLKSIEFKTFLRDNCTTETAEPEEPRYAVESVQKTDDGTNGATSLTSLGSVLILVYWFCRPGFILSTC